MSSSFKILNFRFFCYLLGLSYLGVWVGIWIFNRFDLLIAVLGVGFTFALICFILFKRKSIKYLLLLAGFIFTLLTSFFTVTGTFGYVPDETGDFVTVGIESVSVDKEYVFIKVLDGLDNPPNGEGRLILDGDFDSKMFKEGAKLVLSGVHIKAVNAEILEEFEGDLVGTGELNLRYFSSRLKYTLTADTVESYDLSPNLIQGIRNRFFDLVSSNLDGEQGGVLYALFTGDKYGIDTELYRNYRMSGVAHVLAVSGLHVTFLVSFISSVLKKFKMRKRYQILILLPLLLIFNAVCNFTPSVVRASVMSSVYVLTPMLTRRRYDGLSSMCFAGVVLLFINPLNALSYGFILSFLCVFGVFGLTPMIMRKLRFLPDFLASSLAMSSASVLAVFPISLVLFSEASVVGILTNILVVPILGFSYGILFAVAVFGAIFPVFGFLMRWLSVVIYYVNYVVTLTGSLDFAVVSLKAPVWFVSGYYLLGISLTDYVFLSKVKKVAVFILFVLLVFIWLISQGYAV